MTLHRRPATGTRSRSSKRVIQERCPAFAAVVGQEPTDGLASFHLKRLLNGATGTRIQLG